MQQDDNGNCRSSTKVVVNGNITRGSSKKANSPVVPQPPPIAAPGKWRPSAADKQLKPFYKKSRSERATEAFLSSIGGSDFGSTGVELVMAPPGGGHLPNTTTSPSAAPTSAYPSSHRSNRLGSVRNSSIVGMPNFALGSSVNLATRRGSVLPAGAASSITAFSGGGGANTSSTTNMNNSTGASAVSELISNLLHLQKEEGTSSSSGSHVKAAAGGGGGDLSLSAAVTAAENNTHHHHHHRHHGGAASIYGIPAGGELNDPLAKGMLPSGGFRKRPLRPWRRMTTAERRETQYLQSLSTLGGGHKKKSGEHSGGGGGIWDAGADADDDNDDVLPPLSELGAGARSFYETQIKRGGNSKHNKNTLRRGGESDNDDVEGSPTFTATTTAQGGGMSTTELFDLFDEKLKREWERNQTIREHARRTRQRMKSKSQMVGDSKGSGGGVTQISHGKMGLQVQPEHLDALIPEDSGKTVRIRYYAANMRGQQEDAAGEEEEAQLHGSGGRHRNSSALNILCKGRFSSSSYHRSSTEWQAADLPSGVGSSGGSVNLSPVTGGQSTGTTTALLPGLFPPPVPTAASSCFPHAGSEMSLNSSLNTSVRRPVFGLFPGPTAGGSGGGDLPNSVATTTTAGNYSFTTPSPSPTTANGPGTWPPMEMSPSSLGTTGSGGNFSPPTPSTSIPTTSGTPTLVATGTAATFSSNTRKRKMMKKKKGEVKLIPLATRQHQLVMISSVLTNFETSAGQLYGARGRGERRGGDDSDDNLDIEDGEGGTEINAEDDSRRNVFGKIYVAGSTYTRRTKASVQNKIKQLFAFAGEAGEEEQEAYYERLMGQKYSAEELRDITGGTAALSVEEKEAKKETKIAERKGRKVQERLARKREKIERKAAERAVTLQQSSPPSLKNAAAVHSNSISGGGRTTTRHQHHAGGKQVKIIAAEHSPPTQPNISLATNLSTSTSTAGSIAVSLPAVLRRTDHGPRHSHHLAAKDGGNQIQDDQSSSLPPSLELDHQDSHSNVGGIGGRGLGGHGDPHGHVDLGSGAISENTEIHSSVASCSCSSTSSSSSDDQDSDDYHSSDDSDDLICDEDAYFLDDPTIKGEHRRKLISLPGYRCSIIPFSEVQHLEEDINNRFWLTHPYLQPLGLKLTHLRKIKSMLMLSVAMDDRSIIDLSTVIFAIVYFEKLVLKLLINENNRHVIASVCLLIAVKFWEGGISNSDIMAKKIGWMLDKVQEVWGVSKKTVLEMEMKTYVALEFSLLIPPRFALTHFVRQLETCNLTPSEYMSKIQVLEL